MWAELFGLEEEVGPAGLVSGFLGFGPSPFSISISNSNSSLMNSNKFEFKP